MRKGTEEYEMFRDFWKILEENWGVEDSEEYWDKVIEDTKAFYGKYETEFAKKLALSLINELERRAKSAEKVHSYHSKR